MPASRKHSKRFALRKRRSVASLRDEDDDDDDDQITHPPLFYIPHFRLPSLPLNPTIQGSIPRTPLHMFSFCMSVVCSDFLGGFFILHDFFFVLTRPNPYTTSPAPTAMLRSGDVVVHRDKEVARIPSFDTILSSHPPSGPKVTTRFALWRCGLLCCRVATVRFPSTAYLPPPTQ